MQNSLSLILHNVRSCENVGSILRSADAAGVEKVYLCGITPAPIDRFGRPNPRVLKASLGAEKNVEWEEREDSMALIEDLRQKDVRIYALEQSKGSVDYRTVKINTAAALIVGNEVDGIGDELLTLADTVIEIPMRGIKESLNVSVACGIILFSFSNDTPQ